ncbi:MAG TPA: hypothetical protein DCS30_06015 [Rhizobiales bacterium]|nr:hypothetical protein [Hyphomicrobiales bacterium]
MAQEIVNDSRAMLYCVTDLVDTNFIVDRFFKKHAPMIGERLSLQCRCKSLANSFATLNHISPVNAI